MAISIDYSKWEKIIDEDDKEDGSGFNDAAASALGDGKMRYDQLFEAGLSRAYADELPKEHQTDKLKESKIRKAMDLYEQRRSKDKIMHHYWIKEAGDPDVIGEYFPTGDARNDCPVYKNQNGIVLSREEQPRDEAGEDYFGWVLGNMKERRPIYGVMSEDVSVPTLGWQSFTGPEPVPTIRYYTDAAAARVFKDRANKAFGKKNWDEAEGLYTQALDCNLPPAECAEPLGMILSNRAETRLRKGAYEGAEEDAEQAMKHFKNVAGKAELKQKTVVRRAKALQSQKRFGEAAKVLREARGNFYQSQEIERLLEEMEVSIKGAGGKTAARAIGSRGSTATEEVLRYMTRTVESMQSDIADLGDKMSNLAFPEKLAHTLKKLEYLFVKAKSVEGYCLRDLQTVLRTNGGLQSLLQIVQTQWNSNLDGKVVDMFKLHGLSSVAVVISHAAEGSTDNLKLAACEAHSFVAMLGGCNRKVEVDVCERLMVLVSLLWEQCRAKTLELVQPCSIVVERAAAFLSKATLAELTDDAGGPDAPTFGQPTKDQALALLFEWLAAGGRVEKRALRGAVPQLADVQGAGFLTAERGQVREFGALVASKAVSEPSLLSAGAVHNLLQAVQLLIHSGPLAEAEEKDTACIAYDDFKPDSSLMHFVDLDGWELREDGRHAALALQLVSKALEFRLLLNGRELHKDDFELAFMDANGLFVIIPLLQSPLAFAEHALLCLASLSQANSEFANNIVGMCTVQPLLGLPSPEVKPMPSHIEASLRQSAAARRHTAKILSKCVESQVSMDLLKRSGEKCIKELVKLTVAARADGKSNLEGFHDMLFVFHTIAQLQPGPLCRYVPVEMLNLLVDVSATLDSEMAAYAAVTVRVLGRDRNVEAMLAPIMKQAEGTKMYDIEDELKGLTNQID